MVLVEAPLNHNRQLVVFTVHGTFSPSSPWAQPGSQFCNALASACKFEEIEFRPFVWRGYAGFLNNSHEHRLEAAERLGSEIKACVTSSPGKKVFVIGHSHGGNVALYAMRDVDVESVTSGVACLSTPFFECKTSTSDFESRIVAFAQLLVGGGACAGIAWFAFIARAAYWPFFVIAAALILFFSGLLSKVINPPTSIGATKIAEYVKSRLEVPQLPESKVYCAAGAWDEAVVLLEAQAYISKSVRFLRSKLALLLAYPVLVDFAYKLQNPLVTGSTPVVKFLACSLIGAMLCGLQIFTSYVLEELHARTIRLAAYGFDETMRIEPCSISISVRKSPPWMCTWRGFVLTGKSLAHSRLTNRIEVAESIGEWISSTASEVPGPIEPPD